MNNLALLLLDLQRDFLECGGRMAVGAGDAKRVVSLANRLIEHGGSAGWKLIFIKNEFPETDRIGNFFRKDSAIEGSAGAALDPRITIAPTGLVLTKSRPDAFTNPALAEALESDAVRQIVVLGVMAEGHVSATVTAEI